MTGPLKSLSELLSSGFGELAKRAENHASAGRALTQRVRAALPEPVRAHVVGARRQGVELTVLVDSAAWSARVRYGSRALVSQLDAPGEPAIEKIRVRVRPP